MLDSKEQVLEFELTSHGKKLLYTGDLEFSYYSFSDDDIIYDSEYSGYSEDQTATSTRIESTPIQAPLVSHKSVSKEIHDLRMYDVENDDIFIDLFQDSVDRDYEQILSLGTSDGSQYRPAWDIQFYSGMITSSIDVISGTANVKIPTLELAPQNFKVSLIENIPDSVYNRLQLEGIEPGVIGSFIRTEDERLLEVVPEDIFIELDELNTLFGDSNLQLEIYVYESSGSSESLMPLYFNERTPEASDIYNEDDFYNNSEVKLDQNSVETYFLVQCDEEIPKEIVCKYVPQDRRIGIYGNLLECDAPRKFVLEEEDGMDIDDC